jgi:hypothetical protein
MKYVVMVITPTQVQFHRFNTREVAEDIAEELRRTFEQWQISVYED